MNNEIGMGEPVFMRLTKVSRTDCKKLYEAIKGWIEHEMAEQRKADRAIVAEMMCELRFMLHECVRKEERENKSEGWMTDGRWQMPEGGQMIYEVLPGMAMGVMVGRKRGKDPRLRQRMERRKAA